MFKDWEAIIVTFFQGQEVPSDQNAKKANLAPRIGWSTFMSSLSIHFREESVMTLWNLRVNDFKQAFGQSIVGYGLCFDAQIVESYSSLDPIGDLLNR